MTSLLRLAGKRDAARSLDASDTDASEVEGLRSEVVPRYPSHRGTLVRWGQPQLSPLNGDADMAPKDFGDNGKTRVKGKTLQPEAGGNAPFRGYINVTLTSEEKGAFAAWLDPDTFWAVLSGAVVDGVNVAVKPDPKQKGFLASATQRREDSVNAGLCVTARAGSPELALTRLAYILALLSRSERWEDTQPLADPDRW